MTFEFTKSSKIPKMAQNKTQNGETSHITMIKRRDKYFVSNMPLVVALIYLFCITFVIQYT